MTAFYPHLVLGGARSGKSRFAENAIRAAGRDPWVYIATAEAFDPEMEARIERHRLDRGSGWVTVDAPHDLAAVLDDMGAGDQPILVDCLTLWLSNRLLADADLEADCEELVAAVRRVTAPLVLVSNEVGFGIVPDNALARRFRDAQGRLNQDMAAIAAQVTLVVAGLPVSVK
ncbi:bifunctional adenosylcobinamide kinase/adenosylcobinamide-phosphate guanylyltransferase [Chthonobacter rhizosphaerae]|uniref:bifunctional adenosylcobinamide kinase/adenosylcobinamide-phosphate guanylyltransferase n=1 Tax=Chthonobacter rhizosphaerae TaxID=2735553 RepID=UPI0015EFAF47|nr:bifunctional adenosylcobinamide kinase/adenosylcobinamide-phosphate guanylyltransferase [Chthonobacter rhizosphaerae]